MIGAGYGSALSVQPTKVSEQEPFLPLSAKGAGRGFAYAHKKVKVYVGHEGLA